MRVRSKNEMCEIGLYTFILIFLLAHIFLGIVFLFSTIFKRAVFNILSTFGYIAVLCSLHFLISKYIDIYDSSLATVLCFINPISAYVYGLEHLFIVVLFKQPLKFFTFWDYYLPFSVPIFCLLFQCIFYILLTFYFDYVLPIDDSQKRHPLFFVGKKFANEIDVEEDELPEARSKIIPPDTPIDTSSKSPDIEVTKLVKKWKNDEVAVKNVSFRAYRDQVTSLLGHNGAGKSTIFGILTGTIRPTAGIVRLIGEPPAAIGEDSLVGFCPQWNPLFPYLTVEEHLSFYGNIKTGDSVLPEEIDNVLNMIGLFDDRKLRGSQLSGGMKRKLCVGIAMIGESRILLLDEPTAGIDPMARRAMLQIIEKVKEGRTVLLTTHYMDEADFLSDRIIIMLDLQLVLFFLLI
uniref:ABC transporter domain-containing protein n=1 Tax=Panagrolaimus davidi TaxID=227884 RepID=A0A914PHG6_9BILA